MKKLRFFDSLKSVLAAVACMFILNVAHAAILPAGYTELEYLQTDGNAYIDTGILLSTTDVLETELMVTNLNATKHMISTSGTIGPGFFQIAQTSSLLLVDFGTPLDGGRVSTDTITSFNNKVLLKANVATKEFYVNNTYVGNAPNSDFIGSANSIKLFALPGEPDIRIYNFKILGKINLVPARRDSDGVLGMYDLSDSNPETAFHTNAGTGNFIAGEWQIKIATTKYNEESFAPVKTDLSAAVNAVEYVVSNTMSQAQAIDTIATTKQTRPDEGCMAKYCLLVEDEDGTPHWYPIAGANGVAHNLPTGYTELQYIESTGTQYIDTGLKLAAQQTPFLIDIDMSFSDMSDRYLIGFNDASPAYAGRYSNGKFEINNRYSTIKSGIDEKLNFQYGYFPESNNAIGIKVTKNGESEYLSSGRTSMLAYNTNWYIFAVNTSDSSGTFVLKGKIYSAKAYKDNELVFNGIPAKNSSDVVGMYDMVSGTFFTNAGTGVFTGPEM